MEYVEKLLQEIKVSLDRQKMEAQMTMDDLNNFIEIKWTGTQVLE